MRWDEMGQDGTGQDRTGQDRMGCDSFSLPRQTLLGQLGGRVGERE